MLVSPSIFLFFKESIGDLLRLQIRYMSIAGTGLVACKGCTPASLAPLLIGLHSPESELFEVILYSRSVHIVSNHRLLHSSAMLNMAMASKSTSCHINMAQIMLSFQLEGAAGFQQQHHLHSDSKNSLQKLNSYNYPSSTTSQPASWVTNPNTTDRITPTVLLHTSMSDP